MPSATTPNEQPSRGTASNPSQDRSAASSLYPLQLDSSVKEEAKMLNDMVKDATGGLHGDSARAGIFNLVKRVLLQIWTKQDVYADEPQTLEERARDDALRDAWTAEQGIEGGDNIDTRHLTKVEFWARTTFLSKHKSSKTGASFGDSGPVPYWIKLGLHVVRPIVQHYQVNEASLTPWQIFIRERAKTAVRELEEVWCADLERAWKEADDEERRKAEGSEGGAE